MKRHIAITILCVIFVFMFGCVDKTPPAYWANQPPQGAEMVKVPRMYAGDHWEFQRSDYTGYGSNYGYSLRVVKVNPDGSFKLRYTKLDTGKGHTRNYNSNYVFKTVDGAEGEKIKVRQARTYNFPLWIGKRWTAHFSADSIGGHKYNYTSKYVVLGKETVAVPAGIFDAYKVRYDIQISSSGRSHFIHYYWYAPKAKIIVKDKDEKRERVLVRYQVR
jgi:hypothetical protein